MSVEHAPEGYEERLQYQFNLQADQVQKVLGHHGMPTSVVGGKANSRSFLFDLQAQVNGGLRRLSGLRNDLKQTLGVDSVRFLNEDGGFQLQVLRPIEPAVPLLDLLRITADLPPAAAVLGLRDDGHPMIHCFAEDHRSNILITGAGNAGKTILLRTIAASLAMTSRQAKTQLVAINPVAADRRRHERQDSAIRPLGYLPHMLSDVAVRQTEITELLLFLAQELNYRLEKGITEPRIVILIDQAATVLEHGGRTIRQAVHSIAQRGSQASMHLVLSTRRPDADVFSQHLLTNLQMRYIGKLEIDKATEHRAKPEEVEATTLLGEGDFISANGSRGHHFQAAYIDDYDLHMSLSKLYYQRPILLAKPMESRVKLEKKAISEEIEEQQYKFLDDLIPLDTL